MKDASKMRKYNRKPTDKKCRVKAGHHRSNKRSPVKMR